MELSKKELEQFPGVDRINVFVGDGTTSVDCPVQRQKIIDEIKKAQAKIAAGDYVENFDLDEGMPQCSFMDFTENNIKYKVFKIKMKIWEIKKYIKNTYKWYVHKIKFKLFGNYHKVK